MRRIPGGPADAYSWAWLSRVPQLFPRAAECVRLPLWIVDRRKDMYQLCATGARDPLSNEAVCCPALLLTGQSVVMVMEMMH
ncbi:hypothetical protein R3I93_014295 [Phoxinus phoxinus]|uniref:Uncharacterized protein n=1 Tax=Phoxinus phoxinus TaxID=58324 RepID=A0AAN9GZR3_9TELE